MVPIMSLWLPILLSAVLIFLASWLVHTVLPMHKSDYGKLEGEDAVLEAMRKAGVKPGDYVFPHAGSMKEMQSAEIKEKVKQGPVGFMTVAGGDLMNMGPSLAQWFIYLLVVGVFVAYMLSRTLPADPPYMTVFRVAGTLAFVFYAGAHASASIWYKRKWSTTWKYVFDGFIYGLLTAGVFGWLWPR